MPHNLRPTCPDDGNDMGIDQSVRPARKRVSVLTPRCLQLATYARGGRRGQSTWDADQMPQEEKLFCLQHRPSGVSTW